METGMMSATSEESDLKSLAPKAEPWSKRKLITASVIGGVVAALAGFFGASESIKKANDRAMVQIEQLSTAIEKYMLDNGDYPGRDEDSPFDGDISEQLYNELFYEGYMDLKENGGDGEIPIYLNELNPLDGKSMFTRKIEAVIPPRDMKILDPWGRPYRYRKGTLANNPDYDLWSTGKDGMTDPYDPSRTLKENRDDIRNF